MVSPLTRLLRKATDVAARQRLVVAARRGRLAVSFTFRWRSFRSAFEAKVRGQLGRWAGENNVRSPLPVFVLASNCSTRVRRLKVKFSIFANRGEDFSHVRELGGLATVADCDSGHTSNGESESYTLAHVRAFESVRRMYPALREGFGSRER